MDVLRLDWAAFDRAIGRMVDEIDPAPLTGVYGVPRGGLVLAVALSHWLNLPLAEAVTVNTLVVDDIHDSGETLRTLRAGRQIGPVWVWVTREANPRDYRAVLTDIGPDWVVFPWEDPQRATQDRQDYEDKKR